MIPKSLRTDRSGTPGTREQAGPPRSEDRLAADRDGNIWFTANFKAYIGKLDPRTGQVTEYSMPDARARDPHSLVFNREGTLFFTAQDSNFVGRLDPKTGKVTLKEVPTAH